MSASAVRGVVRQLGSPADPLSDAELLTAFAAKKDTDAFAALVTRHGPNVFGVCRRVLGDSHDAEDAFQAVFLVLAQKAARVRPPGSIGGWLYGVAVRTANKAKVAAARRRRREMIAAAQTLRVCDTPNSAEQTELCSVLDQELARLPDSLRAAIVLCDLLGKTRAEAAAELDCPEGTVAARQHRGRKKLADALFRRGLSLPAAGLTAVLTPAAVSGNAVQSALSVASGTLPSPVVLTLAREVIRGMTTTTRMLALSVLTLVVGSLLAVAGTLWSSEPTSTSASLPTPATETIPEPQPGEKSKPPSGYVSDLRFSPDGKQYAVAASGKITVYDTATRKAMWNGEGEAASFLPDGKTLIVMGAKVVTLHDKETGKATKEFPRPKINLGWHIVAFSPDGKRYAAHFGFSVRVYDTETGFEPIRLGAQHEPGGGAALAGISGNALFFSPDSKKLFAVGVLVEATQMGAASWDLETGARIDSYSGNLDDVPQSAAVSPDGVSFAIGYYKNRMEVRTAPKDPAKKWPVVGRPTTLAFSPDGKLIAVGIRKGIGGLADKEPRVSDEPLGKITKRLTGDLIEINLGTDVQVQPGMKFMVLPEDYPGKGRQSRMRVFRVPNGKGDYKDVERFVEKGLLDVVEVLGPKLSRCRIASEYESIRDAIVSGDLLYEVRNNGEVQVQVLDAATGKEVRRFDDFGRDEATVGLAATSLAFSPDGKLLLGGTGILPMEQFPDNKLPKAKMGEVKMWNLDGPTLTPAAVAPKWREKAALKQAEDLIVSVAFAPSGKTFAARDIAGNIVVWNAADHKLRASFNNEAVHDHSRAIAYSPESHLAFTEEDGIRLFDFDIDKLVRVEAKEIIPKAIAFGPTEIVAGRMLNRMAITDGQSVIAKTWLAGGPPSTARFGPLAGAPKIEGIPPAGVAYSPDGKQLVFIPNYKVDPDAPTGKPDPIKATHWIAQVWGAGSGAPMALLAYGTAQVTAVAWSPDGKYVAAGGTAGDVVLWDGKTFKEVRRKKIGGRGGASHIHALAFTRDGKAVAVATTLDEGRNINRVVFIDTVTGGNLGTDLQQFDTPPLSLAFSPDGKTLVVGCGYRDVEGRKLTAEDRKKLGEVRVFTTEPEIP
jgi:RNA polymerase sigma factor (sigma-70 family)